MTATLASDVQLLNGLGSDGLAVLLEALSAVLCAIIFSLVFSWPMTLVGIAIMPFMMICITIASKYDNKHMLGIEELEGSDSKTDDEKASQILASDSISNFKTVASFGNDQILLEEFGAINQRRAHSESKSALCSAISLGVSVGFQNVVFAIFYYSAAMIYDAYGWYEPCRFDKLYIAMFAFIYGAFTAAQATAIGPDVGKAKGAALKIYKITDTPSKIDVLAPERSQKRSIDVDAFRGQIEFRDVWFRYPARLNQWVFKGLNLTIHAEDNIAIVGESGQGKSTMIGLLMRFYDPEFG